MTPSKETKQPNVLESAVRVPEHVVYRSFAHETVVLNLKTGRYHGLNPTAGTMLNELERGGTVREVADRIATTTGWPCEQVRADISDLCVDLSERGLIELVTKSADRSDGGGTDAAD